MARMRRPTEGALTVRLPLAAAAGARQLRYGSAVKYSGKAGFSVLPALSRAMAAASSATSQPPAAPTCVARAAPG